MEPFIGGPSTANLPQGAVRALQMEPSTRSPSRSPSGAFHRSPPTGGPVTFHSQLSLLCCANFRDTCKYFRIRHPCCQNLCCTSHRGTVVAAVFLGEGSPLEQCCCRIFLTPLSRIQFFSAAAGRFQRIVPSLVTGVIQLCLPTNTTH